MNIGTNSAATGAHFGKQYLNSHTRVILESKIFQNLNTSSKVEKRIKHKNKYKATPGRGIRGMTQYIH